MDIEYSGHASRVIRKKGQIQITNPGNLIMPIMSELFYHV
jgi:hypothetical protein